MENTWIFPAEWERQEGVLLCFPYNDKDWPGKYGAIQWAFVEFIKKVAEREKVFLIVKDQAFGEKVRGYLETGHVKMEHVSLIPLKTNRSWMRDAGPIIVKNGTQRKALDFNFNGWAKYSNWKLDRHVPSTVANHLQLPVEKVYYKGKPVILEGGAIDVNGKGTLLTSEECLLHPSIQVRNQGFTRHDYENIFAQYLGITNVIWLGDGIVGDDTHGHIDDLARFVDARTIVTVTESNKKDENYRVLQENLERLHKSQLEDGSTPRIVNLPMPRPLWFDGIRIPASYANFLIINDSVLVPTFNDPNDLEALNILKTCFPQREVIGIGATDLIWGFGTLHCLSQQIPA